MSDPTSDPTYDHVLSHPPRCLDGVRTAPVPLLVEDRGEVAVAFRLLGADGAQTGEIFGFDLRDYNEHVQDYEFVSPLAVKWDGAPDGVVVFDSDIHGYHGELDCSAKIRGEGAAQAFACPACQGTRFSVFAQFDYDGTDELWDEDPDTVQNFFSNLIVAGQCASCNTVTRVLDMDL
ncbi:MAG: hypothetical protein ACN6O5_14505 [Achromobacter sp.]|uniref:hypothetical protein n=1 Tax=unclassified Achromobacter TaxID=2626865 RepID=UPI0006F6BF2D|nr:hypothetical protein [Achromobacter sp. Root565]KQZ99088.1 hypothetical protein ASD71_19545 [Achromobacter sp. Root565]